MLLRASLENFKSFDRHTELTMVASEKVKGNEEHKMSLKDVQVLKYGVVYGANAAGKSNLVDFFEFVKACVRKGTIPLEAKEWFCKSNEKNKSRESRFELQFVQENVVYAYGFAVMLCEGKIASEWLYRLEPNGDAVCLFEREGKERPFLGESIPIEPEERSRFAVYAEDFEGNETKLFLTEMNQGKKHSAQSKLLFFRQVHIWFRENLFIIRPDTALMNFANYFDEASMHKISNVISAFDTGISQVSVQEISIEQLEKELPRPIFEDLLRQVRKGVEQSDGERVHVNINLRSERSFYNVSLRKGKEPRITTLDFRHKQSFYNFRFEEESEGTRRLFDLLDIMLRKGDGVVYIVDELERSLHPKLIEHYLRLFMKQHKDRCRQLLFTTHEASLLDQSLFRRDEVWFVERDEKDYSTIYSLERFKEHYGSPLSKEYLEGRYGAIPIFSSFADGGEE